MADLFCRIMNTSNPKYRGVCINQNNAGSGEGDIIRQLQENFPDRDCYVNVYDIKVKQGKDNFPELRVSYKQYRGVHGNFEELCGNEEICLLLTNQLKCALRKAVEFKG